MKLDYATPEDIRHVARHMRDSDFAEFAALSTTKDRFSLAEQLVVRFGGRPDVLVATYAGCSVAIGGLIAVRPNVASLLFFATDDFIAVGLPLTKMIKQELFPEAKQTGIHRIEAVAMADHLEAHRWIEALGLQREGPPIRGFGKGGEAYQSFSWVRDDCPAS